MNAFEEERNRQIVPRWLPFWAACELTPTGVIDYSFMSNLISLDELEKKEDDWAAYGSMPHAADLVATAFPAGHSDRPSAREAAAALVASKHGLPRTLRDACKRLVSCSPDSVEGPGALTDLDAGSLRSVIRTLKRAANERGPDPFLYIDLAFYYTLLAQDEAARRYVRMALALGDDNPLLLRAAARFYLHSEEDPGPSLALLRKSRATKYDPTLMAAEIAISEAFELTSRLKSKARRVVEAKKHHPFFLSELAGTVGTFEMKAQSVKRAKRAFRVAVECPTENTLAQITWASRFLQSLDPLVEDCKTGHSYEADAITQFQSERYFDALESAEKWLRFQPFSSRSAIFASYIAGVSLEDHGRSVQISRQGLVASPDSFGLRNNLAFALALQGNTEAASEEIEHAAELACSEEERAVASATQGLISFRRGDDKTGRLLYKVAIDHFQRVGGESRLALASVFYAREEQRIRSKYCAQAVWDAISAADRVGLRGVRALEELRQDSSPEPRSGE